MGDGCLSVFVAYVDGYRNMKGQYTAYQVAPFWPSRCGKIKTNIDYMINAMNMIICCADK